MKHKPNNKTACDRCGERKKAHKMTVGCFGYADLCKACKYQLEPKQTLDKY